MEHLVPTTRHAIRPVSMVLGSIVADSEVMRYAILKGNRRFFAPLRMTAYFEGGGGADPGCERVVADAGVSVCVYLSCGGHAEG